MTRLLALLMVIASPAMGLELAAVCGLDPAEGRVWPLGAAQPLIEIWPTPHRGNVVAFAWSEDATLVQGFVQLCQAGDALRWSVAPAAEDAVNARLYDMLESDTAYSLGDVGRMVEGLGGRATLVANPGLCACESVGY